jgi:hypothetical protein
MKKNIHYLDIIITYSFYLYLLIYAIFALFREGVCYNYVFLLLLGVFLGYKIAKEIIDCKMKNTIKDLGEKLFLPLCAFTISYFIFIDQVSRISYIQTIRVVLFVASILVVLSGLMNISKCKRNGNVKKRHKNIKDVFYYNFWIIVQYTFVVYFCIYLFLDLYKFSVAYNYAILLIYGILVGYRIANKAEETDSLKNDT